MTKDAAIVLAAITGAHGVTGDVRLKLLGQSVDSLRLHDSFNDGTLTLGKLRSDGKGGAIARFCEIADRTKAEKLRGTVLTVPRDTLPRLGEDEYYHADLIGLAVETDAGVRVGRVVAVENFGATDIVEIEREPIPDEGAKTFMVPLTQEAVPRWDETIMIVTKSFVE